MIVRLKIRMDQWRSKFSESFSLDRYWSIECSSLHVMRAIVSVRPKCSHRCVSLKEAPSKPVQILQHRARISTEQTSMRTKLFKHIAISTVQEQSSKGGARLRGGGAGVGVANPIHPSLDRFIRFRGKTLQSTRVLFHFPTFSVSPVPPMPSQAIFLPGFGQGFGGDCP